MQEQMGNPYFKIAATQLQGYTSVSQDVIAYEAEHRARIAQEERFAAGYKSAWHGCYEYFQQPAKERKVVKLSSFPAVAAEHSCGQWCSKSS